MKGTAHGNFKPFKNQGKYVYQFCARLFEEEEEEEDGEIGGLAISRISL